MFLALVAATLIDLPSPVSPPDLEGYRGVAIIREAEARSVFRLFIKDPGETWLEEAGGACDALSDYLRVVAVFYVGSVDRNYTVRVEPHRYGAAEVKGGQSENFDDYVNAPRDELTTSLSNFGLHDLY